MKAGIWQDKLELFSAGVSIQETSLAGSRVDLLDPSDQNYQDCFKESF